MIVSIGDAPVPPLARTREASGIQEPRPLRIPASGPLIPAAFSRGQGSWKRAE